MTWIHCCLIILYQKFFTCLLFTIRTNYLQKCPNYRTKKLRREDLDWADFIYVMEKKHLREIQKMGYYEKVSLLYPGEDPSDIPDPFGKDFKFYVDVSKIIEESIKKILKEIKYRYS